MALFNVKDFGAVGNGLADDTVAIRVALKYALANQSGVRFPAGQYLVTDGAHTGASQAKNGPVICPVFRVRSITLCRESEISYNTHVVSSP